MNFAERLPRPMPLVVTIRQPAGYPAESVAGNRRPCVTYARTPHGRGAAR
jgi:hypothetical protein